MPARPIFLVRRPHRHAAPLLSAPGSPPGWPRYYPRDARASLSIFRILRIWRMILGSKPVPLASADFLYVLTERPLRLLESLDALGEGLQPRARDTPTSGIIPLPRW